MFTGDRSGDFLYAALHRAGLANQPKSESLDDGLELKGTYITASVRCAPPGNRPNPAERKNCRRYLESELDILESPRVIMTLGGYAYDHTVRILRDRGHQVPSPKPRFGHGRIVEIADAPDIIASYHPSQQNTFTGKLTPSMLDDVLAQAKRMGA